MQFSIVTVIVNLFYAVVLFSAAGETEGLLSGACLVGGILTTISIFAMLISIALLSKAKNRK